MSYYALKKTVQFVQRNLRINETNSKNFNLHFLDSFYSLTRPL